MFTARRALRLALRVLAALMIGGTVAIGPRLYQPRLPQGAKVELVTESPGDRER